MTEYLTAIITQDMLRRLQVHPFSHLLTLPLSYDDRPPLDNTMVMSCGLTALTLPLA